LVTVNPNTPVDAGLLDSVEICIGQSVTLTASGTTSYSWSPSTALSSVVLADVTANPTQTTTYTVTGTTNGCTTTDNVTVVVNPLPLVDAGNISPICLGSNVTLSGSGASSYVWNNGITDGVPFTPSVPGDFIYNVTGTDANGCENTDQVTVKVFQLPLAVFSADVLSGQTPLNVNFTNSSQMANTYSWDFGNGVTVNTTDLSPVSTTYSTAGVFTVTLVASNGICTDDQILIITTGTPPPMEIFVPNVFTPNDKEDNEGYWVNVINGKSFEGVIVNRWGNVMYTMGELNEKWDGNYNGKPAEDGVYFIKYTATGLDGEVKEGHTFFHLIR
jgi:gliding motility-associated-like protein